MSPKSHRAAKGKPDQQKEHSPSADRSLNEFGRRMGRRGFLVGAILVIAYHVLVMAHDINRPFYGLHSWAAASGAWAARVHVKYGWDYTGGVSTWAVGDPPPENPGRYLDHPQLSVNLKAVFFLLTGPSEWASRLYNLIWSTAGLVAILAVFRGLLGPARGLLAGVFFVLFPITAYFGTGGGLTAMAFLAIYCYLAIIRGMPHGPEPGRRHWFGLVAGLFFMMQFGWPGVFYAMAMGLHYVGTRVRQAAGHRNILAVLVGLWVLGPVLLFAHGTSYWWFVYPISFGVGTAWLGLRNMQKKWLLIAAMVPFWVAGLALFILDHWFAYDWWWVLFPAGLLAAWLVTIAQIHHRGLLGTVVLTPLASLGTNLAILLSGYNWDITKLIDLYRWRSAKGELTTFEWSAWFHKLGEHALSNFTLPALIVAGSFLVIGIVLTVVQVLRHAQGASSRSSETASPGRDGIIERFSMFPGWSLIVLPMVLQLFVLRGALWMHQSWERPMAPLLAVCCALGVLLFRRIGATASQRYPNLAGSAFALGLTLFLSYYCWMGTRYYYAIRWQHPQKIAALKWLNQQIPADKPLLSFRSFIVDQHSSKGAFLRPEIAWYLDRPVQVPMSMEEIAAEFQRAGARGGGQRWQFEQTAEAIVRAARRAHKETGAPFFLMLGNPQAVAQPDRRAGFFDRLAHFMARKLPVANLYPGRSGQKGGWGSPGRVRMVPWTIFDLREPQPSTGRATPLPE